jgi:signal transduction histidine kinase
MMENSASRAVALIEDVMDLARSRLGGGIQITPTTQPLAPALQQVVNEMKTLHPRRQIETTFDLPRSISADHQRLARLVSNLLSNALSYSPKDTPVILNARSNGALVISVTNQGSPIPAETQKRLFIPFERGAERSHGQGLGLGLYIVSQIAEAHGGSIHATSTDEATCFTFRMPLPSAPEAALDRAPQPAPL